MPNPTPRFDSCANAVADDHTRHPSFTPVVPTTTSTLPSSSAPAFADILLDLAAAVEAQDAAIKDILLEAAEAGNLDLIKKIVGLWAKGPVSEVMAQLREEPCVDSTDARIA